VHALQLPPPGLWSTTALPPGACLEKSNGVPPGVWSGADDFDSLSIDQMPPGAWMPATVPSSAGPQALWKLGFSDASERASTDGDSDTDDHERALDFFSD